MAATPITDISFKAVVELVGGEDDEGTADALDRCFGALLLGTSVVSGSPVPLALIGAKNEYAKLVRWALGKLTRRGEDRSFAARQRRMAAAHVLLIYAAFFEAAETSEELGLHFARLREGRRARVAELAAQRFSAGEGMDGASQPLGTAFRLPHPTGSLREQRERIEGLYLQLADQALAFVGVERGLRGPWMDALSADALAQYEAGYVGLCGDFPEFFAWAGVQEMHDLQDQVAVLGDHVAMQLRLAAEARTTLDLGLTALGDAVRRMPERNASETARKTVAALRTEYETAIAEPVIVDRFAPSAGRSGITYPTREEVFVPQAHRQLRYDRRLRLEDEQEWADRPLHDDIGAFLLSYLDSPYSVEAPLIVLGQPGSGKSLLTEVLAARLATDAYTPVRIPLREVKAEQELELLIEARIRAATGREIVWADFSEQLTAAPPLVLLDGFDELLQASGEVHSQFLAGVARFQQRELRQGRPVRVLVTSRITLIDKGHVPAGATVLRLEAFDEHRRERWIDVWNRVNDGWFQTSGVEPFALPDSEELVELASQPLLLLMLALYDSDANALHSDRALDRTLLYDELLRRFVERERRKDADGARFATLTEVQQQAEVALGMRRLGVAALGMFNRQSLHLAGEDLDADLGWFRLAPAPVARPGRRPLTPSEQVFGSFFFVHESRATAGADDLRDELAFEFLHNTFGEHLAADFLLEQIFEEVGSRIAASSAGYPRSPDVTSFPASWFATLAQTPLATRPVIVETLREWSGHLLARHSIAQTAFESYLRTVVDTHVREVLDGDGLPGTGQAQPAPFERRSLLARCAVYTLNLVVLAAALGVDGFRFDDAADASAPGAPNRWERLTHLWRAWLSLDQLRDLASVAETERHGDVVCIRLRDRFERGTAPDRLEAVVATAAALDDALLGGLAELHAASARGIGRYDLDSARTKLERERIDLDVTVAVARLDTVGWDERSARDERLSIHVAEAASLAETSLHHQRLLDHLCDEDVPERLAHIGANGHAEPGTPALGVLPPMRLSAYCRFADRQDDTWLPSFVRSTTDGRRVEQLARAHPGLVAEALRLLALGRARMTRAGGEEQVRVAVLAALPIDDLRLLVTALAAADVYELGVLSDRVARQIVRRPPSEAEALSAADLRLLIAYSASGRSGTSPLAEWLASGLAPAARLPRNFANTLRLAGIPMSA